MSIASEIQRINTNISNVYTTLENKGIQVPSVRNSGNLVTTVDSINSKLNVGVVGSPTINGTVVSGFSTSNYLNTFLMFNLDSTYSPTQSWEHQFKITTGSSFPQYERITGTITDKKGGANIVLCYGHVGVWLTNTNTGWEISAGNQSSEALTLNKTYWIRLSKPVANKHNYVVTLSEDGSNFTQLFSVSTQLANAVKSTQETIIGCGSGNWPFLGSIDLSECYIKVGNVYLWRGCTT